MLWIRVATCFLLNFSSCFPNFFKFSKFYVFPGFTPNLWNSRFFYVFPGKVATVMNIKYMFYLSCWDLFTRCVGSTGCLSCDGSTDFLVFGRGASIESYVAKSSSDVACIVLKQLVYRYKIYVGICYKLIFHFSI